MIFFCSICNKSLKDNEIQRIGGVTTSAMCPTCKGPCFPEKFNSRTTSNSQNNTSYFIKNFIILILIAFGTFFLWKNKNLKSSFSRAIERGTVVIEFNDGKELLAKLKQVKTGNKLRLHQKPQKVEYVNTGISCNDHAAKAAYREAANRELEQRNKEGRAIDDEINKELLRIQKELGMEIDPY